MYTLISGSPKSHSSNSMHFLKTISSNIEEYNLFELRKDKYEEIIDSIEKSSTIIFAFPLYVDSPPSIMLAFLDYIIDSKIKLEWKLIYTVINCGFREGKQNITAANIIKNWCEKVEAIYGCSIQIGAGEVVGKDKYKFISKKALKCLKDFSDIVKSKQKTTDITTTMDLLNNRMYCYIANLSWDKKGKTNNLSPSDLKSK